MDIQSIIRESRVHMDRAIENTKRELNGIRSGKASPSMLDVVRVEMYGSTMALNQVASVSTPEARLILVTPYDKPTRIEALRYVAHWVTPVEERPRRFDTRFFLAAAPPEQEGSHDNGETIDSRWVRPAVALAQADAGELMLLPPTIAQLRFLAECSSVADALAKADAAGPPPRLMPTLAYGTDGTLVGVALPDGTTFRLPARPQR